MIVTSFKKFSWQAWQSYEEVTETFVFLAGHPFEHLRYDSIHFCRIEKFTVILYDKTSESPKFGERDLFCQKNRAMDRIPSTTNALNSIPPDLKGQNLFLSMINGI